MFGTIKRFWGLSTPSYYEVWSKAFDRLQAEKRLNGRDEGYWRIWYDEVCPAYRALTNATPADLRHPMTSFILEDIDKPLGSRKNF